MARLPTPGSDDGAWGDLLNTFLEVEHNSDGTLKTSGSLANKANDNSVVHNSGSEAVGGTKTFTVSPVVPTPTLGSQATNKSYVDGIVAAGSPNATAVSPGLIQLAGDLGGSGSSATAPVIADGAITNSKIANGAISTNKLGAGAVTSNEIADATITNTDISATAAIARTKLDSSSQTSLAKADTAIQPADLSGKADTSSVLLKTNNLSDVASASTARANLGLVIGTDVQAHNANLDTLAGKTAPTGSIVGTSDAQTLTNKTLTSPTISSITNTGTISLPTTTDTLVGRTTSDTLTNKRITKRVVALTDGATISTNCDNGDIFTVTLGGSRTISSPTGTPTEGQQIMYRLTQDATGSRVITWGAAFRFSTDIPSPTLTTTPSKTDYIGFQYNSASSTWDCLAVARGY